MVSVKAAATGRVSWGPMVSGLGPLEHPETHIRDTAIASVCKTPSWVIPHLPEGGCHKHRG